MNILIDILPQKVEIDNIEYRINYDFHTSILFEIMMQEDELDDKEKINNALLLYYPVIPDNFEEAIKQILWFYRGGKEINGGSSGVAMGKSTRAYSFEYDDDYIYSAFLTQYGIDLQDIEDLHWWKFKAMFKSLKEDNEIVKIMGYRSMTINSNMSKEQKDFYSNMKKIYAIPLSKSKKQKVTEIENALMGNGDLSGIL
ncbi:bacteriophage Gp15 family protein [Clostridium sp.]|uniref:bacteriophage Gp15 family protein n=1 Tax=Clostridium sp. TaxID=1506 RepID=UPI0032179A1D